MATLDDIKIVLEGIRADLAAGPGAGDGLSAGDMSDLNNQINENTEAMNRLGQQADQSAQSVDQLGETGVEAFDKMNKRLGEMNKSFGTWQGSVNMMINGFMKMAKSAKEAASKQKKAINALNKLTTSMRAATGASSELVDGITRVGDSVFEMGDHYADAAASIEALMRNNMSYTRQSAGIQTALARDIMMVAKLGFGYSEAAKGVEFATSVMGTASEDAGMAMVDLRAALIDIQVPLDEGIRDFNSMSETLATLGPNAIEGYKEIRQLTKETSMSIDAIRGLDDQMYTFEGATTFAAKMNQALQGSFFDPHELMQAYNDGPAAVTKLIRERFDEAGADVDTMGRRHLKFIASGANMGVEQFTKMMRGEIGALEGEIGRTSATRRNLEEDFQVRMKDNVQLAKDLVRAADPLVLPAGAAERHMRGFQDASAGSIVSMSKIAGDAKRLAADAAAAEMSMATMAANVVEAAADTPTSGLFAGLAGFLGGAALSLPKVIKGIMKYRKGATAAAKATWQWTQNGRLMVRQGGRIVSPQALSRMQKMSVGLSRMGRSVAALGPRLGAVGSRLGALGAGGMLRTALGGVSRLAGLPATAIVSAANAVKGGLTAVYQASLDKTADFKDRIGAFFLGLGKGAADAMDFLTVGLVGKLSSMTNSLGLSFKEAWKALDFGFIWETFEYAFDSTINSIKGMLGISSPSQVMMSIGTDMVEGLVYPFQTLGAKILPLIKQAADIIPAPIKALFGGDDASPSNLGNVAASANTAASELMSNVMGIVGGDGGSQDQTIEVNMVLDGKIIDNKVLKVVGGALQPLTY